MTLQAPWIVLVTVIALAQEAPSKARIEALDWIAGCWTLASGQTTIEEQWMRPSGGTMLGMSRTVRGGKTTEYEFLQIREGANGLEYVARPSGQPEATFTIKTIEPGNVVFENPAHDFPQRVMYRKTGDATATARIEGTRNGQLRGVDFPFHRCQ